MKCVRFESKRVVALIALAVVALVSLVPKSEAANVYVSGAICTEFGKPAAQSTDVIVILNRIKNDGPSSRQVVCAVPRSPAVPVVADSGVIIHGINTPSGATSCTVHVQNPVSTVVSKTDITFDAQYHLRIPLNSNELPFDAIVAVVCQLPPGGILTGITLVQ